MSIFQQKLTKTRTKIMEQENEKMEFGRAEQFDHKKTLLKIEAELVDKYDKRIKGAKKKI